MREARSFTAALQAVGYPGARPHVSQMRELSDVRGSDEQDGGHSDVGSPRWPALAGDVADVVRVETLRSTPLIVDRCAKATSASVEPRRMSVRSTATISSACRRCGFHGSITSPLYGVLGIRDRAQHPLEQRRPSLIERVDLP